MKKLLVIAFMLCLTSPFAFAKSSPVELEEQTRVICSENYYGKGPGYNYADRWCILNIRALTERLQKASVDLDKSEVLVIFSRTGNGVWPQESRNWAGDGWTFHAVLNFRGTILDLDFKSTPTPISLHDYFFVMFNNGEGNNQDLLLTSTPANKFASIYLKYLAVNPRRLLKPETDFIFPTIPLHDFLSK